MKISEFDYNLPENLIAQYPAKNRDFARLMVLDPRNRTLTHDYFFNLVKYLGENDLVVVNNTRVFPARLIGHKETGGRVELLLIRKLRDNLWEVLMKPAKRLYEGVRIFFKDLTLTGIIEKNTGEGKGQVRFDCKGDFMKIVEKVGSIPLPPYIRRNGQTGNSERVDRERYQTVYAMASGSVAAPTAGLHFTPELIQKLRRNGTDVIEITLHVGTATFRPLTQERVKDHIMEEEWFSVSPEAACSLNLARLKGKRIVAVGTTSTRVLETIGPLSSGEFCACSGSTNLFIYPGYKFRLVDKLITNFHSPRSTPLLLASALAGKDFLFMAYQEAVRKGYRFLSFGDATLII